MQGQVVHPGHLAGRPADLAAGDPRGQLPEDLVESRELVLRALEGDHLDGVAVHPQHPDQARSGQPAQVPGDGGQRGVHVEVLLQRVRHRDPGLEPGTALLAGGPGPGTGDHQAGDLGEHLEQRRVPVGERLAAGLLGQVEVPVDLALHEQRHPEEGSHRGMPGREADGQRVLADVVEDQRPGVVDEHPEHTLPGGEAGDPGDLVGADPEEREVDDLLLGAEHAEEPEPGAGDRTGELDDPVEQRTEGEVRLEVADRREQGVRGHAAVVVPGRHRATSLTPMRVGPRLGGPGRGPSGEPAIRSAAAVRAQRCSARAERPGRRARRPPSRRAWPRTARDAAR